MKIKKLFIGKPKNIDNISTSMQRQEVIALDVYRNRIHGDEISNKIHHGGANRIIHQYPLENYILLNDEFPKLTFFSGCMGENISSVGMTENNVCIGDIYRIGDVHVMVTEPRKPCWTIDHVMHTKGLARKIQESCKTGWFYKVIKEGNIKNQDHFKLLNRPYPQLDIKVCVEALLNKPDKDVLNQMATNPVLSRNWKIPASRVLKTLIVEDDSLRLKG